MTWTLEHNDDLKIVVLTYKGKVTGADIKEAATARIQMGNQKNITRFLIDTQEVESNESATMDIYELPSDIYQEKQCEYESHIAVVEPKSSKSKAMVRFFENVCVNRGWLVKTFQDCSSAVKWLQEDRS